MVLYQHIILTLPKYSPQNLTILFKRYSETIMNHDGVVRGIENHGIRPLQERAKRKYATLDGTRYFWEARYISATFDLAPKNLIHLERVLNTDEGVLRFYTTKKLFAAERFNSRSFRNPYLETKYIQKK